MFGKSQGLKVALSVGFLAFSLMIKDASFMGAFLIWAGATGLLYKGLTE
ncbi:MULTISPECIES: hypothetical protein [Vibrio]|nr:MULTISPECIES: hypothetical protein [Vibrio]EHY9845658.1 hypothetical protein [Vibrio cholerae]MCS0096536.1 hypothetical protein [Vibrio cholerae]